MSPGGAISSRNADVKPQPFWYGERTGCPRPEPSGFPPSDGPFFGEGAQQHEAPERDESNPRPSEPQPAVKRRGHDAVDHLDMNPVDEERAAPEQLQRAPPRRPWVGVPRRTRRPWTRRADPGAGKESLARSSRTVSARTATAENDAPVRRATASAAPPSPRPIIRRFSTAASGRPRSTRREARRRGQKPPTGKNAKLVSRGIGRM